MPQLRNAQAQRTQPCLEGAIAVAIRMMLPVNLLAHSVRGAACIGSGACAIDSYPVGNSDPGALCTACKPLKGGIHLRGSGHGGPNGYTITHLPWTSRICLGRLRDRHSAGRSRFQLGARRDKTLCCIAPERDQQFAGDCNNSDPSTAPAFSACPLDEPGGDIAFILKPNPAPSQLNKTGPYKAITSLTDALLVL